MPRFLDLSRHSQALVEARRRIGLTPFEYIMHFIKI
jgi:hypothetical protein